MKKNLIQKTPLPDDENIVQEDNGESETIDESQQSI